MYSQAMFTTLVFTRHLIGFSRLFATTVDSIIFNEALRNSYIGICNLVYFSDSTSFLAPANIQRSNCVKTSPHFITATDTIHFYWLRLTRDICLRVYAIWTNNPSKSIMSQRRKGLLGMEENEKSLILGKDNKRTDIKKAETGEWFRIWIFEHCSGRKASSQKRFPEVSSVRKYITYGFVYLFQQ